MKKVLFCMIALCLYACVETKEKSEEKPVLGKYVYVDTQSVLHVKDRCVMGLRVANENSEGLQSCRGEIITMSIEEAEDYGLTPCGYCYP